MLELGLLPLGVPLHARGILDTQLLGQILDQLRRHIQRIGQEHPQIPHRHKLKREPQPVVIPTPTRYLLPVLVIEVEKPLQLNTRQRPKPAIATLIGHACMKSPAGQHRPMSRA